MKIRLGCIAALALMFGTVNSAVAADTASGLKVARKLCINCHIVEPDGRKDQVTAGIPSFMAIANKAGQTESELSGFMLNPHPPMPEVQLTTDEIDNIVAYILSLKEDE